jgi:hypothetical protein
MDMTNFHMNLLCFNINGPILVNNASCLIQPLCKKQLKRDFLKKIGNYIIVNMEFGTRD